MEIGEDAGWVKGWVCRKSGMASTKDAYLGSLEPVQAKPAGTSSRGAAGTVAIQKQYPRLVPGLLRGVYPGPRAGLAMTATAIAPVLL